MAAQLPIHAVANQTIRHLSRRQLVEALVIRPLVEVPMARQPVEALVILPLAEVPVAHQLVEALAIRPLVEALAIRPLVEPTLQQLVEVLAIRPLVEVPTIHQLVEPLTTLQQEITQTILHLQVKIQPALAMTYKLRSLSLDSNSLLLKLI